MKLLVPTLVASLLVAMAAGQSGREPQAFEIVDREGNLALRNLRSQKYTRNADGSLLFEVGGVPVRGEWKARGLTMAANQMTVVANRLADGNMEMKSAVIQGGAPWVEVAQRPSGAPASQTPQVIRIESPKITYTASSETLLFESPMVAKGSDPLAGRVWNIKGSNGHATLYPREPKRTDGGVVKTFELGGPVTFELEGTATKTQTVDGQQRTVTEKTLYKGSANRMTFDDATKVIRLVGKVKLETDDFVLAGGDGAESATIKLDDKLKVISVEMAGGPGESRLRGGGEQ